MQQSAWKRSDYHRFVSENTELFSFCSFQQLAYSINVSRAHRVMFFDIPKNASSYIKLTLQRLETNDRNFNHVNLDDIHDRTFSPLASPFQVPSFNRAVRSDEYFKFCLFRDPFERLVSAYIEKITTDRANTNSIRKILGIGPEASIPFEDFVYAVCAEDIMSMDLHWKIQYYQSMLYAIPDIRVYRVDQIPKLLFDLAAHTGQDLLQFAPSEPMNKVDAKSRLADYSSDQKLVEMVHAKFSKDLDTLERV